MDRLQRTKYVLHRLATVGGPVKGLTLAEECRVTRQVIVGDIAKLRILGKEIISTPRGYQLVLPERVTFKEIFACHHGMERMREELYAIVDQGWKVLNVSVEHQSYGYLKMDVKVGSREEAYHFVSYLRDGRASFMTDLRDGLHRYFIEAKSKKTMGKIRQELAALDGE